MNRTEKILRESYGTAAVLRDGGSHKILRLRNIKTGKDIIKITFTGSDEIYKTKIFRQFSTYTKRTGFVRFLKNLSTESR